MKIQESVAPAVKSEIRVKSIEQGFINFTTCVAIIGLNEIVHRMSRSVCILSSGINALKLGTQSFCHKMLICNGKQILFGLLLFGEIFTENDASTHTPRDLVKLKLLKNIGIVLDVIVTVCIVQKRFELVDGDLVYDNIPNIKPDKIGVRCGRLCGMNKTFCDQPDRNYLIRDIGHEKTQIAIETVVIRRSYGNSPCQLLLCLPVLTVARRLCTDPLKLVEKHNKILPKSSFERIISFFMYAFRDTPLLTYILTPFDVNLPVRTDYCLCASSGKAKASSQNQIKKILLCSFVINLSAAYTKRTFSNFLDIFRYN